MSPRLTDKEQAAVLRAATDAAGLAVARQLIRAGVPVFAAQPATRPDGSWDPAGGTNGCGYWLPTAWEKTIPTEDWLDPDAGRIWAPKAWRPGWALCAVMGAAVDGLDCDPRHDGEQSVAELREASIWPRTTGLQRTPSGGWHQLAARLGVGSKDGLRPGLDLKGGRPDGGGRGFLFIAPTVKRSKETGELVAYRWEQVPDLAELDGDTSGEALAAMVLQSRSKTTAAAGHTDWQRQIRAGIPAGQRDDFAARYAASLRAREVPREQAEAEMLRAWEAMAQPPGKPFTWEQARAKLDNAERRYPPGRSETFQSKRDERVATDPDQKETQAARLVTLALNRYTLVHSDGGKLTGFNRWTQHRPVAVRVDAR